MRPLVHLEGQRAEEQLAAIDTKRAGGGIDHFLECILNGEQSHNSIRQARHSLAVALATQ